MTSPNRQTTPLQRLLNMPASDQGRFDNLRTKNLMTCKIRGSSRSHSYDSRKSLRSGLLFLRDRVLAIMLSRLVLVLLLAAASAWPQSATIPDTPAGHTLQAWLDAFNSGDRAPLQAYAAEYDPGYSVDQAVAFREQTGGFELMGIDKSDKLHIEFRVKEKASSMSGMGKMDFKDGDPAVVATFMLRAIPQDMTAADMHVKMDAATRTRVIEGAV